MSDENGDCYDHFYLNGHIVYYANRKNKLEMCPLEHVWPAIQHSFKWGATTIKQQYKMGNQFKDLKKKKNYVWRRILIA